MFHIATVSAVVCAALIASLGRRITPEFAASLATSSPGAERRSTCPLNWTTRPSQNFFLDWRIVASPLWTGGGKTITVSLEYGKLMTAFPQPYLKRTGEQHHDFVQSPRSIQMPLLSLRSETLSSEKGKSNAGFMAYRSAPIAFPSQKTTWNPPVSRFCLQIPFSRTDFTCQMVALASSVQFQNSKQLRSNGSGLMERNFLARLCLLGQLSQPWTSFCGWPTVGGGGRQCLAPGHKGNAE